MDSTMIVLIVVILTVTEVQKSEAHAPNPRQVVRVAFAALVGVINPGVRCASSARIKTELSIGKIQMACAALSATVVRFFRAGKLACVQDTSVG
jgi:hypothetical protein